MMAHRRVSAAAALLLLALAGCAADEDATEPSVAEIAAAASTGPYEVGDTVPAGEESPHEARREAAERLAREQDRDFAWVTDAYTFAEGGEVVESYYAVDATAELRDHLSAEWATFDTPEEALEYAEEVVATVGDAERYVVVPYEP